MKDEGKRKQTGKEGKREDTKNSGSGGHCKKCQNGQLQTLRPKRDSAAVPQGQCLEDICRDTGGAQPKMVKNSHHRQCS